MKKILLFAVLISLPIGVMARTPVVGNMWNVSDYNGVYGAELNTDGQFNPMTSGLGCLGSSTYKWDIVSEDAASDTLTINTRLVATEIMAKCDSWDNILAKSTFSISGIAGIVITTATCVSDKYYIRPADITQVAGVPRNLMFNFATAGSTATAITEGLDARGNRISQSHTICGRTLAVAGDYAFSLIYGSTLTITKGIDASITLFIGDSDKIGLMGDIDATTDVYSVKTRTSTATWADETSSVTVDATYDTWTHSDVPDAADDYLVFYRANSE
jgi:hypothetical protein